MIKSAANDLYKEDQAHLISAEIAPFHPTAKAVPWAPLMMDFSGLSHLRPQAVARAIPL